MVYTDEARPRRTQARVRRLWEALGVVSVADLAGTRFAGGWSGPSDTTALSVEGCAGGGGSGGGGLGGGGGGSCLDGGGGDNGGGGAGCAGVGGADCSELDVAEGDG